MRITPISSSCRSNISRQSFGAHFSPLVTGLISDINSMVIPESKRDIALKENISLMNKLCPDAKLDINTKGKEYKLVLTDPRINGDIILGRSSIISSLLNDEAIKFHAAKMEGVEEALSKME